MRLLPHIDWASLTRRPRALHRLLRRHRASRRGEHALRARHLSRSHRARVTLQRLSRALPSSAPWSKDAIRVAVAESARARCAPDARTAGSSVATSRSSPRSRHAVRPGLPRRASRARGRRRACLSHRPDADAAPDEWRARADRRTRRRALHRGHAGHDLSSGRRSTCSLERRRRRACARVVGVPVGHIDDQWTIPIGADAELDADAADAHRPLS
jgi:hypothetical protein